MHEELGCAGACPAPPALLLRLYSPVYFLWHTFNSPVFQTHPQGNRQNRFLKPFNNFNDGSRKIHLRKITFWAKHFFVQWQGSQICCSISVKTLVEAVGHKRRMKPWKKRYNDYLILCGIISSGLWQFLMSLWVVMLFQHHFLSSHNSIVKYSFHEGGRKCRLHPAVFWGRLRSMVCREYVWNMTFHYV